jgi:homoaconitase/3-isopropylmalate dehydratase large subunit
MLTISEKILSRAAGTDARAGDFVLADIDCAMAHDGTSVLAVKAFTEMGADRRPLQFSTKRYGNGCEDRVSKISSISAMEYATRSSRNGSHARGC